jgi:hypothetical protein
MLTFKPTHSAAPLPKKSGSPCKKNLTPKNAAAKLFAFLLRRGFEWDTIARVTARSGDSRTWCSLRSVHLLSRLCSHHVQTLLHCCARLFCHIAEDDILRTSCFERSFTQF